MTLQAYSALERVKIRIISNPLPIEHKMLSNSPNVLRYDRKQLINLFASCILFTFAPTPTMPVNISARGQYFPGLGNY